MPCPKVTQLIVYGLLYKFAVKWIFDNLKIIWIKKKSKKIGMSGGYSFGIFKDPPGQV